MSQFAQITVGGRLSADATVTEYGDGKFRVSMTIPVNHPNGKSTDTSWYNVVCFGFEADQAIKAMDKGALRKGQQIVVMGRLTPNRWQDKQGNMRTSLDIIADTFRLMGSRPEEEAVTTPATTEEAIVVGF